MYWFINNKVIHVLGLSRHVTGAMGQRWTGAMGRDGRVPWGRGWTV